VDGDRQNIEVNIGWWLSKYTSK